MKGSPPAPAVERAVGTDSLLREAIEILDCHYAIFDAERRLLDYSASYAGLHQAAFKTMASPLRYDDLMREAIRQTLPGAAPQEAAAELARRIAAHESDQPGDFDRLYPGGRWMRVAKRRLSDGHVAGLAVDITALKHRETAITVSEARYRALVDTAPVGIWHLDEAGRTLFANARLARLFGGRTPDGLAGAELRRENAPASEGPFGFPPGQEVEASIAMGGGRDACVLVCASGWLPLAGGGGRGAVLTLLDITPLKAAQAQAEHLAWHDPLTGLGNRAKFQQALAHLPAHGAVLILVDLDHFKETNDRHGHAAGDALLCEAASRLQAALQPGDLACRLGGDEFALLVRGTDAAACADTLAHRLARTLSQPAWAGDVELAMSASLGHAAYPADAGTADALQCAADLALYAAKHRGRGRAVGFLPVFQENVERRRLLGEALAEAIAGGRLRLVWQPQVSWPGKVLRGAEALVRWPDSPLNGRTMTPGEFLSEAREAGLTSALDEWTLEAALCQARDWVGQPGAPSVVAVNLSAGTLRDPALVSRVAETLLRHGVPPAMLEIEVPETAVAHDLGTIAPLLGELRAMGVRIALDNFGSGVSSVAHLVRLPVNLVKLDRSIVAGLPGRPERAILHAVMALAGSLAIPVLAEGVETEAQSFVLRREGCRTMQGYLFGHPVPGDELAPPRATAVGGQR